MWAPLGHPLTTSWEVKDIQEERSLKELKMGLFNQPEGFPLRPKKRKDELHPLVRNGPLLPLHGRDDLARTT